MTYKNFDHELDPVKPIKFPSSLRLLFSTQMVLKCSRNVTPVSKIGAAAIKAKECGEGPAKATCHLNDERCNEKHIPVFKRSGSDRNL